MARSCTDLIRLSSAALASAAALVALGGAGASAQTSGSTGNSGGSYRAEAIPATLAGIKAKASTDITDRLNDLHAAIGRVNGDAGLGSGQSVLSSYLNADLGPLQQLDQTIEADTTVAQAAKDVSNIFSEFRVYALVLPAARIATDADHATATVIPSLTGDASWAQSHVNSTNQDTLQPLIANLDSQLTAATGAANGLAANVVAFTPAQWNANHDLLASSRSAQQTMHEALQEARSDVHQIAADLGKGPGGRALRGTAGSTTPTTS
jgi:hypothetical protein